MINKFTSNVLLLIQILISIGPYQVVIGHPKVHTSTIMTITRYSDYNLSHYSTADYFKLRDQFLKDESERYLGNDLKLNANELKLNEILMKLKQNELNIGFKNPYEFKGSRHFFQVVNSINESKLFKLIEKMPKGAVLHAHDTAMASIDYVVDGILNNEKYYHILWYCEKTKTETLKNTEEVNQMRFLFSKDKPKQLEGFNDWTLLNDARKNFKPSKLNEILYKQFTLYTENPHDAFKDINEVWNKFANIFVTLSDIVLYEPVWTDYFNRSLYEFYHDNVQYVEFRGLLPKLYDLDGTNYNQMDTLKIYDNVLKQFKKDYPDFGGARFIFGPNRKADNITFSEYMQSVQKFKDQYPELIAGFDLVAQEDLGNPLKDYITPLLELKQKRSDIDFFFHAGETNWNGMDTDENLIDAILLGTKRIGHGYAVLKHPKVMEEIKKRDIAIEVNPISNQVLKLLDDNRNHPCAHLFADNYPVVISSDDPSFWKAKPLSHDFYIAFMGLSSAHSDLRLLKKLAMNSIKYSTLKEMDLYSAETLWEATWNHYVSQMLEEYSSELLKEL